VPLAIELPALFDLGGAAISWVIIWAMLPLAGLLAILVSRVPVFGGPLANGIRGAMFFAQATTNAWVQSAVGAVIGPISFVWGQLGPWADDIANTFGSVYNGITWATDTLVPQVSGWLFGVIAATQGMLLAVAATDRSTAAAGTANALATAEHDIQAGVGAALQYAANEAGLALSQAESDIHAVEALLGAQVAQLTGVVAANQAALESLFTGGLSGVEAQLGQAEAAAQSEIAGAVQGVRDWATANEQALQNALTGAITGGIAGVLTQVATLTEELTQTKQCADPLCTNLSGFGQLLAGLGGYLETGAIFALLAFCVEDPKAAAGAVNDVVSPMASGLGDGLKAVVGL